MAESTHSIFLVTALVYSDENNVDGVFSNIIKCATEEEALGSAVKALYKSDPFYEIRTLKAHDVTEELKEIL